MKTYLFLCLIFFFLFLSLWFRIFFIFRFFLHGIVSALSLGGQPCASNILLKKIKADDELKSKIGYFAPEEIEAEGHGVDIVTCIRNQITHPDGILVANSGL